MPKAAMTSKRYDWFKSDLSSLTPAASAARAKKLKAMREIRIAHLSQDLFLTLNHTKRQGFDLTAMGAHNVMMVMTVFIR